jgi:hypothetical protein
LQSEPADERPGYGGPNPIGEPDIVDRGAGIDTADTQ